jgi:hypothetical protein
MQQPAKWIVIQEGHEPVTFPTYASARTHQRQRLVEAKFLTPISIVEETQS